jgi:hypothetical protein
VNEDQTVEEPKSDEPQETETHAGMDDNGNPAGVKSPLDVRPQRHILPAKYKQVGDSILFEENAYMVYTYPGSTRKGKALAYAAGSLAPESVIEEIRPEDNDNDE